MERKTTRFYFPSIALLFFAIVATSIPETNFLNRACTRNRAADPAIFLDNLNNCFSNLRSQINGSTRFATAQSLGASNPVYALFQCRDYLSLPDCLSCFSTASSEIRKCPTGFDTGARLIYDGCLLRYEGDRFFVDVGVTGDVSVCGNETVLETKGLPSVTEGLLADLSVVTPRMKGYFAAARRGEGGNMAYGVAQCTHTATKVGCLDCLKKAHENIRACLQYKEARAVDAGCFLRYSDAAFFSDNFTTNLAPFLTTGCSSTKTAINGGAAGGAGFLLLLGLLLFVLYQHSKKSNKGREASKFVVTELRGPGNFKYNDLKSATKNYSEENKLGQGGFGAVYKGVLRNGKTVAVKKLTISQSSTAQVSFEAEVKLISNVHHRNLARLLGCCGKGPELLLVYEYVANSSLDKFLFGERRGSLDWKQRFDIIVGTARGLAYLHEEFHACIIHRDIKSSNILIDEDFQPKIADFGLAKLLPGDQSHLSTKFAGTLGYTAPEYAILGQLSEKVDTYSYGIVVLEIISGRRSNEMWLEPVTEYLLEWAWRLYESSMLINLLDENLDLDEYEQDEVKRILEIALSCTQSVAAARPTMSEVVLLLLSKGRVTQKPLRPTFIDTANRIHGGTSTSTGSSISNATLSITQTSGR